MCIHFLTTIAQVTRAIATSEPCAFDTSHASIANCSCMDEGRKVYCNKSIEDGKNQNEIPRKKKKTDEPLGSLVMRPFGFDGGPAGR